MVCNPRSVVVGHHTMLSDNWYLADLSPAADESNPKICIGNYCNILHDFQCNAAVGVEIQDYVLVAPRVFVSDSDHVIDESADKTIQWREFISAPVVIEHNCWIGVNAVILKGVRIGHHSKIGANAVVTKDVPPYSTAVGVPARLIGNVSRQC